MENIALWVKAVHIVSVICWMASLLYLPRLFVYHCGAKIGSVQSDTFKVMEQRLLKAIATPSMILTWVFGIWIASLLDSWSDIWFLFKFCFVIILTVFHFLFASYSRSFLDDLNVRSARFYRIMNEIPAALMVLIVILVVVKPF